MISLDGIALLSPIFISFVLIVQLIGKLRGNNETSIKILLGFMLMVFVLSTSILIQRSGYLNIMRFLDSTKMSLMLLIHPLFFLYIKSLTINRIKLKTYVIHILPALVVFLLVSLFYLLLDKNEAIAYLSKHLLGEPSDSLIIKALYSLLITSKYLHAVQVIVYFFWIYNILQKHKEQVNHLFSSADNYKLTWLFTFNFVYTIMSLSGAISNLLPTELVYKSNIYIEIVMVLFGLFSLYFGIKGMEQPSVGRIIDINDKELTIEEKKELPEEEMIKKINNYIIKDKAYLNKELKIWDIVKNTGINRTYISHSINSVYHLSFNHYINKLRIDMSCNMLESNNNLCIESIAYDCGFNSLSTFNRAFKKFIGKLPSEYRTAV